MTEQPESVGEALPKEVARVLDIIKVYDTFPTGALAAAMMRADITRATKAAIEGDIVEMIRAYASLKEWKL